SRIFNNPTLVPMRNLGQHDRCDSCEIGAATLLIEPKQVSRRRTGRNPVRWVDYQCSKPCIMGLSKPGAAAELAGEVCPRLSSQRHVRSRILSHLPEACTRFRTNLPGSLLMIQPAWISGWISDRCH